MGPRTRAQDTATPTDDEDNTPRVATPQDDPAGAVLEQILAGDHELSREPTVASQAASDIDDEEIPAQERRYAKLFASLMNKAITEAITASKPSASADPTKYPKAKDPGMFNGRKRRYLRTWIGETEICFRTAPNLYRAATSKVMFAGSFLEGEAKQWFTDYFRDPTNVPAFMSDWELFVIELQRNFGLEDELGAAEDDLRKLVMTDKDHATYYTARSPAR